MIDIMVDDREYDQKSADYEDADPEHGQHHAQEHRISPDAPEPVGDILHHCARRFDLALDDPAPNKKGGGQGAEARPVFASVSSLAAFVLQARTQRPTT